MARAVEHFKALCCLGLPKQAAMIAIAKALHDVVPSDWNRIGLFHEDGRIGAGYAEHPGAVPAMMRNMALLEGSDPWRIGFRAEWLTRGEVGQMLREPVRSAYERSDVFQAIDRNLGVHWLLDAAVPNGRGCVGVALIRERRSEPFTLADALRLDSLRSWIAHALRDGPDRRPLHRGANQVQWLPASHPLQRETIVFDQQGRMLFCTEGVAYLLAILGGMEDELTAVPPGRLESMPPAVRKSARLLVASSRKREGGPPYVAVPTPWGTLSVEAAWLLPSRSEAPSATVCAESLIGITLELLEHAAAYAARALRLSGATPTQVRIGVLLALGKQKPEIARELGVKTSSVEDAARKLYARLQVHNAAELAARLWSHGDDRT